MPCKLGFNKTKFWSVDLLYDNARDMRNWIVCTSMNYHRHKHKQCRGLHRKNPIHQLEGASARVHMDGTIQGARELKQLTRILLTVLLFTIIVLAVL